MDTSHSCGAQIYMQAKRPHMGRKRGKERKKKRRKGKEEEEESKGENGRRNIISKIK